MTHTIVFTGHVIDKSARPKPRFPARIEESVTEQIKLKLLEQKESNPGAEIKGISAAACGGDIIFHEQCAAIGIETELYLALPRDEFKKWSVAYAGEEWVHRFDNLLKKRPVHFLKKPETGDKVWAQANTWMLEEAARQSPENVTLMALWNGEGGDGPGGTEHMIAMAREAGAQIVIIDITKIQ